MNLALKAASGRMLLFFDTLLAPLNRWLVTLKKNLSTHGTEKIFGARIADPDGRIAHAGMVVDHNNTPVCAYHRLNISFEAAVKERPFQMVDHFMAVGKKMSTLS